MKNSMLVVGVLGSLLAACSDSTDDASTVSSTAVTETSAGTTSTTESTTTTEETTTTVANTSISGDAAVNYSSDELGFEAYFPDPPTTRDEPPVEWAEVEYDNGDYFAVGALPYETELTADQIEKIKIIAEYSAEELSGAIISSAVVERDGHPGHQVVAETPTEVIWIAVYLDGLRMYRVISVVTKAGGSPTPDEAQAFQEHFHIVGSGL